ncbi:MAG: LysE family translocator [Myxococcales bacterium]|nr:LysE family translocator [Myxococcales bacterium]HIK83765.1 LysE family translocator [Myxococcales bacterium]
MTLDTPLFLSLIGFALATCITPGPNNFMLMSSGALFGFRRTLPHILGIQLGFMSLMASSVLGLGAVVLRMPWLIAFVQFAGAGWLCWFAFGFLAAARNHREANIAGADLTRSRPFKFYEAAFFQWANPKGLIIALSASGAYLGIAPTPSIRVMMICGAFTAMGTLSAATWTLVGNLLNQLMSTGRSARLLNLMMGLLMLATGAIILMTPTPA